MIGIKNKTLTYNYSINDREFTIDYPSALLPEQELIERTRVLNIPGAKGVVKELVFNGICIEQREVSLTKSLIFDVKHDYPLFKMHFEIDGFSEYVPRNNESLPVKVYNGSHQLFFFPKVDGQLHYHAFQHRKTIEISLSLEFIYRVFKKQWTFLTLIGDAIKNNIPLIAGKQRTEISQNLQLILNQIMDCPVSNSLKPHYLEAKVIELLIMQLQSFEVNDDEKKLSNEDLSLEKMKEIETLFNENIDKTYTIEELAKMVGMNTSKLKSTFKQSFNDTIFSFQIKLKMTYALKEIKLNKKSITQISLETGYNYVQHFSKAFKKYYGVLPNAVKHDRSLNTI